MAARRRTTAAAALFGALAFSLVAGCSSDTPPAAAPTPSVSATETPATPEPTVEPAAVEAPAPVAGDAIPADKVEELRAEGVSVYVSPNMGGEGLVVEPGVALPEIVVNDIAALSAPTAAPDMSAADAAMAKQVAQSRQMKAAGLSVLYITYTADYAANGQLTGSGYVVDAMNVPDAKAFFTAAGDTSAPTKEGAIAKVQPLIDANAGIQIIDLTN